MAGEHRTTEELKESINRRHDEIEAEIDNDLKIARHWHGSWDELIERCKLLKQNEAEAAYDRAYDPERQ